MYCTYERHGDISGFRHHQFIPDLGFLFAVCMFHIKLRLNRLSDTSIYPLLLPRFSFAIEIFGIESKSNSLSIRHSYTYWLPLF